MKWSVTYVCTYIVESQTKGSSHLSSIGLREHVERESLCGQKGSNRSHSSAFRFHVQMNHAANWEGMQQVPGKNEQKESPNPCYILHTAHPVIQGHKQFTDCWN